jgi:MoaA/NifB/PqqE/SkfB family radical SAM enzyme
VLLKRVFRRSLPVLDWIQVETTSQCNAACVYCPYTVYRQHWLRRHLTLETYGKLVPFLGKTKLVYLQGWGEPFLNPHFFEMVRLAKEQGCQVGTTTNGILLDRKRLSQVMEHDMDFIAFSLAGTNQKNDKIRRGTSLEQIVQTIKLLNELKGERRSPRPEIHISYMLLRSRLEDIATLPSLLQYLEVNQVVISTLDFIPDEELAQEAFTSPDTQSDELQQLLSSVMAEGQRRGVPIHYQIPARESQLFCTENVERSLFISSDGGVSPCVFTGLPVSNASLFIDGRGWPYIPLNFGNVNEEPLSQIWWNKDYRSFRLSFSSGKIARPCLDCSKRRIITEKSSKADSLHLLLDLLDQIGK